MIKVALISTGQTLGKSCLATVLGGVYSRSQGRNVAIFSTGDATDITDLVDTFSKAGDIDSPHIFKAMVENATEDEKVLFNYGVQAGDEHVYVYNILNASMPMEDKKELLISAIKKVPADLTIIEINGDINNEINQKVLEICDCALWLVDTSLKGVKKYKEIYNSIDIPNIKYNHAIVMSKYNNVIVSDKKFAGLLNVKTAELFKMPYNNMIGKYALLGQLDRLAHNIIIGDCEVVDLRMPLQEIMSFLFNTPTRKIIRSIDKWYR